MKKKLADVLSAVGSIPKTGNQNNMYAFVHKDSSGAEHDSLKSSPVSALRYLIHTHRHNNPQMTNSQAEEALGSLILSGEYLLVRFHLFVDFKNEHILAEPRFGRSLPVSREFPRGEDAGGALSTSLLGHPPIDYDGLPKD